MEDAGHRRESDLTGVRGKLRTSADWIRLIGDWLDSFTPFLAPIALMAVLISAVYVFQGQHKVNSTVDCFTVYTAINQDVTTARSDASAVLDQAELGSDRAKVRFSDAVASLFHTTPDTQKKASKRLLSATLNLRVKVAAVRDARKNLLQVRRDNPLPEPCKT